MTRLLPITILALLLLAGASAAFLAQTAPSGADDVTDIPTITAALPPDDAGRMEADPTPAPVDSSPQLAPEQVSSAAQVVAGSSYLQELLGARTYTITGTASWLQNPPATSPMGASVTIALSSPLDTDTSLPAVDYGSIESGGTTYTTGTVATHLAGVAQLRILVDLDAGAVLSVEPIDGAMSTPRLLPPPPDR